MFCAFEIMQLSSAMFCVVRAVGKFDFRGVIDENLKDVAPDGEKVMQ